MLHAVTRTVARKDMGWALLLAGCMVVSGLQAESGVAEAGGGPAPSPQGVQRMQIHITIGATTMTATLDDNPTARDFAALLPLSLILRDFGAAEKVSGTLSRPLSEQGAPATAAGAVGDIAYYVPWRNIAFYRGPGPNAAGVIRIARITCGIEALEQQGQMQVTVSLDN
jgi:hypothetical protein